MAQVSLYNENGNKFVGFQAHRPESGLTWTQHFEQFVASINNLNISTYRTSLLGQIRVSFDDLNNVLPRAPSSYRMVVEVVHPPAIFGSTPQEKYVVEPKENAFKGFITVPLFLCESLNGQPIILTNLRYQLLRKRTLLSAAVESSGVFKLESIIARHTPRTAGRLALAAFASGTQPTLAYQYDPNGAPGPAPSVHAPAPGMYPAVAPGAAAPVGYFGGSNLYPGQGSPYGTMPAQQAPVAPQPVAEPLGTGLGNAPSRCIQVGCTNFGNAQKQGMCNTCASALEKLHVEQAQSQQAQPQPMYQAPQASMYAQPQQPQGTMYGQPQPPQGSPYGQAQSYQQVQPPQAYYPAPAQQVAPPTQAHYIASQEQQAQSPAAAAPAASPAPSKCLTAGCDNFGNAASQGHCNSCFKKMSQPAEQQQPQQPQYQQPQYQQPQYQQPQYQQPQPYEQPQQTQQPQQYHQPAQQYPMTQFIAPPQQVQAPTIVPSQPAQQYSPASSMPPANPPTYTTPSDQQPMQPMQPMQQQQQQQPQAREYPLQPMQPQAQEQAGTTQAAPQYASLINFQPQPPQQQQGKEQAPQWLL